MSLKRIDVPGKVMLAGEYSVLAGGRSILLPLMDHRLTARERRRTERAYSSPVTESALGIDIPELATYEAERGLPQMHFETSRFYGRDIDGRRIKLGIGLSAAEAVAAVALRFVRSGSDIDSVRERIAMYSRQAHLAAQNGLGSGADVFCCAYRRPMVYRLKDGQPCQEILDRGKLADIPMCLVHTGLESDTRSAAGAFELWRNTAGITASVLVKRLIGAGNSLVYHWLESDRETLYQAVDDFVSIMRTIAGKAGIVYWTDVHTSLDGWARQYGGRAKPVGSGGGDMALIIGDIPIDRLPAYSGGGRSRPPVPITLVPSRALGQTIRTTPESGPT